MIELKEEVRNPFLGEIETLERDDEGERYEEYGAGLQVRPSPRSDARHLLSTPIPRRTNEKTGRSSDQPIEETRREAVAILQRSVQNDE